MKDVRIRATQLCPGCKGECMVTHRAFQSICGFCSGSGRSECELTLPMLKEALARTHFDLSQNRSRISTETRGASPCTRPYIPGITESL